MTQSTPRRDAIRIVEAKTDAEILATRDVMRGLRPQVPAEAYLPTVRRMMASDGYHLAALLEEAAHRFYFRERLTVTAYHFRVAIEP